MRFGGVAWKFRPGTGQKDLGSLAKSASTWRIWWYFEGYNTHRIHGAAIYGNMDPINIPQSC